MLKREFRLKKQESVDELRGLRSQVRASIANAKRADLTKWQSQAVSREASELRALLLTVEDGVHAFDGLIRSAEDLAIKVELLILKGI